MRVNSVAGKALVVLAMGTLGWFSPTGAKVPDGPWCNTWKCVVMEDECNEEDELLNDYCRMVACPTYDELQCGEPCTSQGDPGYEVKCVDLQ